MIISGSSKERSVVVDHNAFLKHDVGIKCFLTCGDDAAVSYTHLDVYKRQVPDS